MPELTWQPGWPTHCRACLRTGLDYTEDGTATCRACRAVTRPQAGVSATTDVPVSAAVHSGGSPLVPPPPPVPAPRLVPARDVSVGIALELFGIALAVAGLATFWIITVTGALLAFLGFVLHAMRF